MEKRKVRNTPLVTEGDLFRIVIGSVQGICEENMENPATQTGYPRRSLLKSRFEQAERIPPPKQMYAA